MDKSKSKLGSEGKDVPNDSEIVDEEVESENEDGAEMAVEDIRNHILDYYGVNPGEEQARKE